MTKSVVIKEVKEFSIVLATTITLLTIALFFVYMIVKNYVDINSLLFGKIGQKTIYIYNSPTNLKRLEELNIKNNYLDGIKYIKKTLKNYSIKEINSLKNIQSDSILFLVDSIALSNKEKKEIKNYLKKGGHLIFNFNTGYIGADKKTYKNKFIEEITGLKNRGYIKKDKDHTFFLISKLMSPIQIPKNKRLDIVLYDKIPVFSGKNPDLEFVNWAITEGIYDENNNPLPNGALWNGKYGKGMWVYFSFPIYGFFNADKKTNSYYSELLKNIVNYMYNGFKIIKYPYLKFNKIVFISEDTEYEFQMVKNFSNVAKKYDVNFTAFCVGKLAIQHPQLMQEIAKNPNLEIASHSYSHTKLINMNDIQLDKEIRINKILLDKLTNQKIVGFRPPREELNNKMLNMLNDNNYRYILWKNLGQLNPEHYKNLTLLSRLGTDDYSFLIELDWNQNKIINKAISEMNFITNLNAIYTLSTHTHLMNYKSNIKMLEKIVNYAKKHFPIYKGKDIIKLMNKTNKIKIEAHQTIENLIINIKNNNESSIQNFTFRVYSPLKVETISSDFTNIKTKIIKKSSNFIDIQVSKIPKFANFNLFLKINK